MAISERSPYNSSFKAPLKAKKKTMKKKPQAVLACNKVKKEDNDNGDVKIRTKGSITGRGKASTSASASPVDRAKAVQSNLPPGFSSCVKLMLRSHVTGGFWLSLPKPFTDSNLPNHDATVVLVDENNEEYYTNYLVEKNGLSAGWRGFSIAHNLLEGDVLVFQLIKPCRIKVYIIRANSLSEIDGAINRLNLELAVKPINNVTTSIVKREKDAEDVNDFSVPEQKVGDPCITNHQKEAIAKSILEASNSNNVPALDAQSGNESGLVPDEDHQSGNESNLVPLEDQSGNEADGFGIEMFDGIRFSGSAIDFKDIKNFESFNILVDSLVIDSEIPKHLRIKYYDLCCSQNSLLHDRLVKGLNCKLAAGIISEIVNIADAIKASKLTTSCNDLQTWHKTLEAFEDMGMKVGFLRDRIKKLVCLQREEQEIIISKTLARNQVEMEEKNLEAELLRVKEVKKNLDADIEALKVKNQRLVLRFKEMATAPW